MKMIKSILTVVQMQQSDVNPVIIGFCEKANDWLEHDFGATKLSQTISESSRLFGDIAFKKHPLFVLGIGKLESTSTFSKKISPSRAITTYMNTNGQAGGGDTHVEYITAHFTGL